MADVNVRGPIFDGRANAAVRAFCDDAERAIADNAVNEVQHHLDGVLRHPTGRYRSRIQTDRQGGDSAVNDGGIIYGPWLEGVGSRNQTTRFKGYATFRRVTARVQASAVKRAEQVLPGYLGRMQ